MSSHYAAFLSYSHSADHELAAMVQRGLQRLGKPWYRRAPIKIFRDETSLSANPDLWATIEQNLAQSDHFLLLASPDAARSDWVAKEVQWWCAHRGSEGLLIIVTDGQIAWAAEASDFDWEGTTCLPAGLRGLLREEPLYVDLRWAKRRGLPHFRDPRFRDAMLMLLAPIYGRPKDELDSEDIRQQRRFKIAVTIAAAVIGILSVGSIYEAWEATRNRIQAEQNFRESESRKLAAASLEIMNQNQGMDRAIILGVLAWRIAQTPEAENALQKLASNSGDVARVLGRNTAEITGLAFSGDNSVLATAAGDGSIVLWRVTDWRPTGGVVSEEPGTIMSMSLDRSGSTLLVHELVQNQNEGGSHQKAALWNVQSKQHEVLPDNVLGKKTAFDYTALSPDGDLVAFAINSDQSEWTEVPQGPNGQRMTMNIKPDDLVVWDVAKNTLRARLGSTPVVAVQFIDKAMLVFLTWAYSTNWYLRVGSWNFATGAVKLGPFVGRVDASRSDGLATGELTESSATFSGNGSKLLAWLNSDISLWDIQADLTPKPLQRPDTVSRYDIGPTVAFDQEGKRVVIIGGDTKNRLFVWDLSRERVIKLLQVGTGHGGVNATLSPNGRWLAAVTGARDEPVVIWDLDQADPRNPAKSLRAVCDVREGGCIRRLCEKVSQSIDASVLRDLVGDSSFDALDNVLRTQPCNSKS